MNRKELLEDIAIATNMAILCTILGSIMSLLVLFHVLSWKNPGIQLGLSGIWAIVPTMFLCRHIFKEQLKGNY